MSKLSRYWAIAVLAVLALLVVAAAPSGPAYAAAKEKGAAKCSDGIDNDGDGLIDDDDPDCGGGSGSSDPYPVTLSSAGGVLSAGTGEINEAHLALENETPNPGVDYYLGAAMNGPTRTVLSITFRDAAAAAPGASNPKEMLCSDFFTTNGGGVGSANTLVDNTDGTFTWMGTGNVKVWLDGGLASEGPVATSWQGLNGVGQDAKARVNGSLKTTVQRGKNTKENYELLFSMYFDDNYYPTGDGSAVTWSNLAAPSTDLHATATGADEWAVTGTQAIGVVGTIESDADIASCVIDSISWTVAKQ